MNPNPRRNTPSDEAGALKGRIRGAEQSLQDVQQRNDPVEQFLQLEIMSDIIRCTDRLNELNRMNPQEMLLDDREIALYNTKKEDNQKNILFYYDTLNNLNAAATTEYIRNNPLIRDQLAAAVATIPPRASSVYRNAVAAFAAAFQAPVVPVNDKLRENIISQFGQNGENLLRHLTPGNYMMYFPGMYARYQQRYGPVSQEEFINNVRDYLTYKEGGRKYKRHVVKRKSMKRQSMKRQIKIRRSASNNKRRSNKL
jgi:predicted transcriptional regulator